jgi:DHA1 family bicyclomycin/chloramphenicol resistance-like MFS transporter
MQQFYHGWIWGLPNDIFNCGAFGISAEKYGFLVTIVAWFFTISAFSSSHFISKIGEHGVIGASCLIALAGGAAMLGFRFLGFHEPFGVIIPVAFYVFGIGWVFPQANALALQPFTNSAGSAAALMGFITNIFSAGLGFLMGAVVHTSALYLATAMLSNALMSCLIYLRGCPR